MARILSVLCVAAALAAPASAQRVPTPAVAIGDCGTLVEQPARLTLTCGDDAYELVGLIWRSWGGSAATAKGTARWTSKSGTSRAYPVTVTAAFPAACGSARRYLRLTIRYQGARPQGIGNVDVHAFTCM